MVPFRSYPTRNRKFQKISKKVQKVKKHHYGFIPRQNRLVKDEKERKEKILFCSVPTRREIENSKKIAKKLKDKKYHYGFIPRQNRLVKDEKERKEKLTLRFVPT